MLTEKEKERLGVITKRLLEAHMEADAMFVVLGAMRRTENADKLIKYLEENPAATAEDIFRAAGEISVNNLREEPNIGRRRHRRGCTCGLCAGAEAEKA